MNVLLVIDGMHPSDGGPPRVVAGSALAIKKLGHNVVVAVSQKPAQRAEVLDHWRQLPAAGIRIEFVDPIKPYELFAPLKETAVSLQDLIMKCDVVHIHCFWSPLTWQVSRFALSLSVPYYISVHGVLDQRAIKNARSKWLKKQLAIAALNMPKYLRMSAGLIFGSTSEVSNSWLPGKDIPVRVVPNGIELDLWTSLPTAVHLGKLKEVAPGYGSSKTKMLFFSRIHEEKGLMPLLDAFANMANRFANTSLLVAGIRQDLLLEAQAKEFIADRSLTDRIYLTTELTGPQWHWLYDACDIFVLPSRAEGFSISLLEAMSRSKPVLITKYCHVPEVAEWNAGFISDFNSQSIEAVLEQLLSLSVTERQLMGQNARRLVLEKYTWTVVAERLIDLYEECTKGPET